MTEGSRFFACTQNDKTNIKITRLLGINANHLCKLKILVLLSHAKFELC